MKKLLIILGILFIGSAAQSQVLISILLGDKLNSDKLEFGLDGGLNLSEIGGLDAGSSAARFNIGFYFDFKLKNPSWMVHTGVIVKSTMGSKDLPVYDLSDPDLTAAFVGGTVDRRLSYFDVPVLMKYQFANKFYVEAGPMFGLMNKSVDLFTNKVKDKDDLEYKLKIRDLYHPIDAGLMAGVGYRLMGGNGMNLGVRYYFGLVDITIDDSTPNQYNRSLYFSVGIPIGKVKSPKVVNRSASVVRCNSICHRADHVIKLKEEQKEVVGRILSFVHLIFSMFQRDLIRQLADCPALEGAMKCDKRMNRYHFYLYGLSGLT